MHEANPGSSTPEHVFFPHGPVHNFLQPVSFPPFSFSFFDKDSFTQTLLQLADLLALLARDCAISNGAKVFMYVHLICNKDQVCRYVRMVSDRLQI